MIATIVIPTYRRHDLLLRSLTAVCLQVFPVDEYEVVVADDTPCLETQLLVEAMASSSRCELRYMPVSGRHGQAAARNCGWRKGRGEIVAFTEDDCIPDPLWLANGVRALRSNNQCAAVWGKLIRSITPVPIADECEPLDFAKIVFETANCFFKRSALLLTKGFDEPFRVNGRKEADLYSRLLEHHLKILHVPEAIVVQRAQRFLCAGL